MGFGSVGEPTDLLRKRTAVRRQRDFSRCVLNENVKVKQITKNSPKNVNCRVDVALDKECAMLQSCCAPSTWHTRRSTARACAARPPPPTLFGRAWDAIIMLGSQVHPRDTGVEATSLAHRVKLATFGASSTCRLVNCPAPRTWRAFSLLQPISTTLYHANFV